MSDKYKLLCFYSSNYEDIKKKGVESAYSYFLEGGLFDEVLFIYPLARFNKNVFIEGGSINIFQCGWLPKKFANTEYKFLKFLIFFFKLPKLLICHRNKIRQFYPDIIRATDPYLLGLSGLIASKYLKKPFVVSIHADYDKGAELFGNSFKIFGSRWLAKKLEAYIYRKADFIFPIRQFLANKIELEFPEIASKIRVFSHGINFEELKKIQRKSVRTELGIKSDTKIISFAGRLSFENYILDICQIVFLMAKKYDDFVFVIYGDGEKRIEFEKCIEQKGIQEKIIIAGFQSREKVISLRSESFFSICLMGGFSLIETCAVSVPAISYDVEWHSDLVVDGQTGILANEGDIGYIVNSLEKYFEHPHKAKILGRNAYQLVRKSHDIKKTSMEKRAHYNQLL